MFDLKVQAEPEPWHRLAPVGYALVFESVHEIPVDICCVVYLNMLNGRIVDTNTYAKISNTENKSKRYKNYHHKRDIIQCKTGSNAETNINNCAINEGLRHGANLSVS